MPAWQRERWQTRTLACPGAWAAERSGGTAGDGEKEAHGGRTGRSDGWFSFGKLVTRMDARLPPASLQPAPPWRQEAKRTAARGPPWSEWSERSRSGPGASTDGARRVQNRSLGSHQGPPRKHAGAAGLSGGRGSAGAAWRELWTERQQRSESQGEGEEDGGEAAGSRHRARASWGPFPRSGDWGAVFTRRRKCGDERRRTGRPEDDSGAEQRERRPGRPREEEDWERKAQ